MANPILTLSNLARTMSTYFRIGTLRINDASAVAEIKDATGAAYGALKATQVRFAGANAAFYTGLTSASGLGASVVFTLPAADGTIGQFLKTDGSTNLGWAAASLYSEQVIDTAFTEADVGALALFTPPADATLTRVQVQVTVAAASGTPAIAIGHAGDTDRDMDELESDLLTVGIYEVAPNTGVTGTPAALIATITVTAAETFTGVVRIWYANAE
jgi:hypothetical protein